MLSLSKLSDAFLYLIKSFVRADFTDFTDFSDSRLLSTAFFALLIRFEMADFTGSFFSSKMADFNDSAVFEKNDSTEPHLVPVVFFF